MDSETSALVMEYVPLTLDKWCEKQRIKVSCGGPVKSCILIDLFLAYVTCLSWLHSSQECLVC